MRGTELVNAQHRDGLRITPAHAGNRSQTPAFCGCTGDHPRTCGEQPSMKDKDLMEKGSPPHMRGTVPMHLSEKDIHGITPAHAGNRKLSEVSLIVP